MPGPAFLRGDSVDLHTVEEDDLPFLHRLVNDPRVWRSLFNADPQTMADEQAFYENVVTADGEVHLLICADGDPVGIIGLNGIDPSWGIAEVGYYVDPDAHGQGYATAAVGLLTDYAFDQRRLEKLKADALATNEASQRVLEKNGFVEEGRFREHGYVDGERVDVVRYGLLASDR
jgi:RimJ/RimL family protein N-acetyltransferase